MGWRYGSGLAVYTERFIDGRLLCASYIDNGAPVYQANERAVIPAFDLVLDGQSLAFGWELADVQVSQDGDVAVGALTLRHSLLPVELAVETRACGDGFFRRRLTLCNTSGDRTLGLTSVTPLRGMLWNIGDVMKEARQDTPAAPFSVGHFRDVEWGNEGNFGWQDIPLNTEVSFGSSLGRSGHGSPFVALRNNLAGGYFLCHLAWSGNWKASAMTEFTKGTGLLGLQFGVMPTALPPMRMIAPGQIVDMPEVHWGVSHEDYDKAVQNLHSYLRQHVLSSVGDGRQPVILNNWGYMADEVSESRLCEEIDLAAQVGVELFMVDAGWFGNVGKSWYQTTGDWEAGDRLPNDLFPVFDYARSKGLQVGMWVEIESAGEESRVAREHGDWFIQRYGQTVERILDLTKPEVAEYVESTLVRLIERYNLDMLRLDYNVCPMEGGFNFVAGCQENTLWRHMETMYGIIDRIRRQFPDLQWENCSGGGGRTDLGMLSRATTTWTSDWMRMPRAVRILNGMSMALPPEYLDRLCGVALGACYDSSVDMPMHLALLAHPTFSGLTPSLAQANPVLLEVVKKYVGIYKEFIRPFHRQARVYHHTPVIAGADGCGWCALEYASPDRLRAVAGVFRLTNAESDTYRLRLRGLDPSQNYRLTTEPDGLIQEACGSRLMNEGLDIRLEAALTSRLLLLQA